MYYTFLKCVARKTISVNVAKDRTAPEANRFNSFLRILEMQFQRKEKRQKQTKKVFIHSSYNYYCEKPVCMRYTVTQFARESVGLCPFCGLYVRPGIRVITQ